MKSASPATPWQLAARLGALGLAAALLLALVHDLTKAPIADAEARRALSQLLSVLPGERFDNDLVHDWIDRELPELGTRARIHRARLAGEPSALIIHTSTPHGYSGSIELWIGLEPDGTVIRVEAGAHRETPGLGDRIERRKSRWIDQFTGRRYDTQSEASWAVDRRGGDFDSLSNATITAQAVVEAVGLSSRLTQAPDAELWQLAPHSEMTQGE